jgi:hypothetical protein
MQSFQKTCDIRIREAQHNATLGGSQSSNPLVVALDAVS